MRREEASRNRSVLLARWRDASSAISTPAALSVVPVVAELRPVVEPAARESLEQFQTELARSVAPSVAQAVGRLLAPSCAAWAEAPSAESREALLAALDVVEDVLDAVLLTGGRPA